MLTLGSEAPPPRRAKKLTLVAGVSVALVVAVIAALALVGRGAGEGQVLTLAQAADRTLETRTARIEFSVMAPVPGAAPVPILVTGEIDFERRIIRYDMDLGPALGSATGASGAMFKATAVQQGLVQYLRMDAFDSVPALRGKWLKQDIGALGAQTGIDLARLQDGGDPAAQLDALRDTEGDVVEVGREKVRGVGTRHVRLTFDIERNMRKRGAVTDEAAFQKLLQLYASTTSVVDAWIDDQGRIRRITSTEELKTGRVTTTREYYDFGVKVDATFPADADVVDPSALAGLGR